MYLIDNLLFQKSESLLLRNGSAHFRKLELVKKCVCLRYCTTFAPTQPKNAMFWSLKAAKQKIVFLLAFLFNNLIKFRCKLEESSFLHQIVASKPISSRSPTINVESQ